MHQRIDGDHAFADLEPMRMTVQSANQQFRERHTKDLVGNPVDAAERGDKPFLTLPSQFLA